MQTLCVCHALRHRLYVSVVYVTVHKLKHINVPVCIGADVPVDWCNELSVSLLLENSSCAATVPSISLGLISLVQRPSASLV